MPNADDTLFLLEIKKDEFSHNMHNFQALARKARTLDENFYQLFEDFVSVKASMVSAEEEAKTYMRNLGREQIRPHRQLEE